MSDLTIYYAVVNNLIGGYDVSTHNKTVSDHGEDEWTYGSFVSEAIAKQVADALNVVASLVDGGVLVPDTRLQAIADAYENYLTSEQVGTPIQVDSCRGYLFRLLDTLVEGGNE